MKAPGIHRIAVVAILLLGLGTAVADPVITRISAQQRPGTKLVDIHYDLSTAGDVFISISGSIDGVPLPMHSLSGDIGAGILAGSRRIVWDAGTDWDGQYTPRARFTVNASTEGEYLIIDLSAGPSASTYPYTSPQ